MTAERLIFVVDNFYYINGKGTVLIGELLNHIQVGEKILLSSFEGVQTTTILQIDSNKSGKMEEVSSARGGESVGIWIDLFKGKVKKDMGVFKESDGDLEFSPEVSETTIKEMMAFLETISKNSVENRTNELTAQLSKYLIPLKAKEENLVYLDDYGDWCFDLWWEECHNFIDKKLLLLKLDIIEECKLLLRQNYEQNISPETMEILDSYLNSVIIIRITTQIDSLLIDFKN